MHTITINMNLKPIKIKPKEELRIRLEAIIEMAELLDNDTTPVQSIIIDARKSLKVLDNKRWWQVWKY
jgi:hypothetical protein